MADIVISYPLDLTGQNPANRVEDEQHTVAQSQGDDYNVIIPKYGPFFDNDNLVVTLEGQTEPLIKGFHYALTHYVDSVSEEASTDDVRREVYSTITILQRSLVGNFKVSYHTVGGPNLLNVNELLKEISILVSSPDQRRFSDIWDAPEKYPLMKHTHDFRDNTTYNDLVKAVKEMAASVRGEFSGNHTHTPEQIIGLQEKLDESVDRLGSIKLAPGNGLRVLNYTGSLGVILPQFVADTRVALTFIVMSKGRPTTITASGLVENKFNSSHGETWKDPHVNFEGTDFTREVRLTYDANNYPVIYLGDQHVWDDVFVVLDKVIINSSIPQKYAQGYDVFITDQIVGDLLQLREIADLDDTKDSLDAIRLNQLLGEEIFEFF